MARLNLLVPMFVVPLFVLAVAGCDIFAPSGGGNGAMPIGQITQTGCLSTPSPHLAPGGYYVNGNTVCTADGRAHLFHGVDRPSLEWSSAGESLSPADFAADGLLEGERRAHRAEPGLLALRVAVSSIPSYADTGRQRHRVGGDGGHGRDPRPALVRRAACSAAVRPGHGVPAADARRELHHVLVRGRGPLSSDDGRVLFELYNEPHDVTGASGSPAARRATASRRSGMQQLYDTVRATGAENLVIIGGLNWAYDLSGVPGEPDRRLQHRLRDPPLQTRRPQRPPSDWDALRGFLTATDPVIATEFGDIRTRHLHDRLHRSVIAYADAHFAGWTAWAWFPGGCTSRRSSTTGRGRRRRRAWWSRPRSSVTSSNRSAPEARCATIVFQVAAIPRSRGGR